MPASTFYDPSNYIPPIPPALLLLLLLLLHVGQTIVGKVVSINIAILSLKFKSHKISVVLFNSALNSLHMESC